MVLPIILLVEPLCNQYLKLLLHVRQLTPQYTLYGELGRFTVDITVKLRMIIYWNRLITGKQSKLTQLVYKLLLKDVHNNVYNHKWIICKIRY